MVAEQRSGQLLDFDLDVALDERLSTEAITQQRQEVIRNVAGHWVLKGVSLPESLDVPGVLSYESTEELVVEPPQGQCRSVYHGYTDLQEAAIADVLGELDPDADIDVLLAGTAQAIALEAAHRIDGYANIMRALDKPAEPVLELPERTPHDYQFIVDQLHKNVNKGNQAPDQRFSKLLLAGTFVTRIQINAERDAAFDTIAGQPVSGALLDDFQIEKGDWRRRLRSFFRSI